MTRMSITPNPPFPAVVVNQIVNDQSTWKIVRQGSQLKVEYDGSDSWYKLPFIKVDNKPTAVNEISKTSCTFTSGGSISMDKLPFFLSGITNRKIEQISVNFDDKVQVNQVSQNKISATISFNGQLKFSGETEIPGTMKLNTTNQNYTITYEGTRK